MQSMRIVLVCLFTVILFGQASEVRTVPIPNAEFTDPVVAKTPKPLIAEQRVPILELSVQIAQLEAQFVRAQAELQKLSEQHATLSRQRNEMVTKLGQELGVKGWMLDAKLQWIPVKPEKKP